MTFQNKSANLEVLVHPIICKLLSYTIFWVILQHYPNLYLLYYTLFKILTYTVTFWKVADVARLIGEIPYFYSINGDLSLIDQTSLSLKVHLGEKNNYERKWLWWYVFGVSVIIGSVMIKCVWGKEYKWQCYGSMCLEKGLW